jgi:hypothetical protein
MGADALRQTGRACRYLNGLINDAKVSMMAPGEASTRGNGEIPVRKDVLTAPFLGGIGVFPSQSKGQLEPRMPLRQGLLMQRLDPGKVVLEQRRERGGKGGSGPCRPCPHGRLVVSSEHRCPLTLSRTASIICSPLL